MSDRWFLWLSNFFTWIRRKWSEILIRWRGLDAKRNSNKIEETKSADGDDEFGDLRNLLSGDFSMFADDRIEIGERMRQFRWRLLSKTCRINSVFAVTTPTISYYGKKDPTWCTSFVKIGYDNSLKTRRIYQCPQACPMAPVHRHTISSDGAYPDHGQLRPGDTSMIEYQQESTTSGCFVRGDRIDTLTIFDLDQRQNQNPTELRRRVRVPKMHKFSAWVYENSQEIKLIYYENYFLVERDENGRNSVSIDRVLVNVYVADLHENAPDQISTIQLVDSTTWKFRDRQRKRVFVLFSKSVANEYFVWFLRLDTRVESNVGGSNLEWDQALACVTYQRDDDGVWQFSNEPTPLSEWATATEYGRRFWDAAELLKEIWTDADVVKRLKAVEIRYEEGMIFARLPGRGYFRRYAFRPPSLQSMAADVVRELVEAETEETKSLEKWNWWRKLVGASGLFDPCPSDYGEEEMQGKDFL